MGMPTTLMTLFLLTADTVYVKSGQQVPKSAISWEFQANNQNNHSLANNSKSEGENQLQTTNGRMNMSYSMLSKQRPFEYSKHSQLNKSKTKTKIHSVHRATYTEDHGEGKPTSMQLKRNKDNTPKDQPQTSHASRNSSITKPICNLSVSDHSANFFRQFLQDYQSSLIRIKLEFSRNVTVQSEPYLIIPDQWVWIRRGLGTIDYLRWPYDLPVVTLNLLYEMPRITPVYMDFNAEPDGCIVHFGHNKTLNNIAMAFRNFTQDYIVPFDLSYTSARWCFIEQKSNISQTTVYRAGILIGWPVATYYNRHRCCDTEYIWENKTISINCPQKDILQGAESVTFPAILAFFSYAFSPLLLLYVYPNAKGEKSKRSKEHLTQKSDKEGNKEKQHCLDEVLVTRREDWVYLDGEAPIKLTKLFFSFCGLEKTYPKAVSRLRRLICLMLSPIGIYLNVLLHALIVPDMLDNLLKHNIPLSFKTVLREDRGRTLFAPYFGGPIGVLAIYNLLGVVFYVIPGDPESCLSSKVRDQSYWFISPLFIPVETVQMLSCIPFINSDGYATVTQRLKAHFFMIWRPTFWSHAVHLQYTRFVSVYQSCRTTRTMRFGFRLVLLTIIPVYLVLSISELILCSLFYGFPLFGFLFMGTAAMYRYLKDTLNLRVAPLHVIFVLLIIGASGVLFFLNTMLFLISIAFIVQLPLFLYIAAIVQPIRSFGYVFFGVSILFYLYKLLSRIGQRYNELLVDVVNICCRLESYPKKAQVNGTLVQISGDQAYNIEKIQINGEHLKLSYTQTQGLVQTSKEKRITLIHDTGLYFGVPREVFELVVQQYRPLYVEVFKTFLQIFLIVILLKVTVDITNEAGAVDGLSDVMHVVFIVLTGALPHVLDMPDARSTRAVQRDIWLKQVEKTIRSRPH